LALDRGLPTSPGPTSSGRPIPAIGNQLRVTTVKKFDRVVFTSDVLKVDDRQRNKFRNPQRVNIDFLAKLIGPVVYDCLPTVKTEVLYGDEDIKESIRASFFSRYGLPMESTTWAQVYDGEKLGDDFYDVLDPAFDNSLVVAFECPPYLRRYLDSRHIPLIDLSIHPVRFMADYLFGVRSNVPEIQRRLETLSLADSAMANVARVSAARTSRVYSAEQVKESSAIFFGQIEIDSSLIYDGKIAGDYEVRAALDSLVSSHDAVYFKAHPHSKSVENLKKLVDGMRGCHWLDVNAYDALGCRKFVTVAALSSGILNEAKYFGERSINRFLPTISEFDRENAALPYLPIYKYAVSAEFWQFVLNPELRQMANVDFSIFGESPLKFMINMKWGR